MSVPRRRPLGNHRITQERMGCATQCRKPCEPPQQGHSQLGRHLAIHFDFCTVPSSYEETDQQTMFSISCHLATSVDGLVSKLADKFVSTTYLNNVVSKERPAPALQYERPNKRKYTVVSPEAKWSILEKARTNRASPTTVLAVQSDSPHLGCNEKAADTWMQKEQAMYWNLCGFALIGSSVHHFCLVSDPGHHNYKECLVSLLWCWELNQGMHCHWQHLVPGKILTPLDATMDEELARYAARPKLERVVSFRQLQGY